MRAFGRLSERIKTFFPRLPILLLLDGLYANRPVMQRCHANHWQFMNQEFGVRGAIRFIRNSCAAPWLDPARMRVLLAEPFLLQLESLCPGLPKTVLQARRTQARRVIRPELRRPLDSLLLTLYHPRRKLEFRPAPEWRSLEENKFILSFRRFL